ncbi:ABC transporter substrate-binding protein [Sanguibacter sp. HDW7]|uniref:ABC transporter substrate-binding protein n=1 Tax=Sanguibacter sp. HDW7 TaxID=2714931 RepID=UPI001408ED3B|nr:ABC transporter substrate-binding protein [Sanguibacter sp. HDW7]QIK83351.1 ABC transporter substrate-binding protein [Sanguibacter sp. HDW7]
MARTSTSKTRPARRTAAAALAVLALAVPAGCAGDAEAGTAQALRPVSIVLDWTPNTNHLGLYLALEKGWFRDAGLDVTIVEPGETSGLQLVAAGKADMVFSVAEALVPAREKGADVVAVAAVVRENTSSLLSLAADGITRPRDLEGKRYGGYGGALENALIDALVTCDGGDPAKLERVPMVSDDPRIDLGQDAYDTTWVFEAWDTIRMRDVDGMDVATLPFADYTDCIPSWYTPLLAVSSTKLASDRALLDCTLDVLTRGYQESMRDPQGAADALLAHVPELDRALVEPSAHYLAEHFAPTPEDWGVQDAATWDAFVAFLTEHDLASDDFDTDAAWTDELLG